MCVVSWFPVPAVSEVLKQHQYRHLLAGACNRAAFFAPFPTSHRPPRGFPSCWRNGKVICSSLSAFLLSVVMTRDAIETQQRPPWWRPQQNTQCARYLSYAGLFFLFLFFYVSLYCYRIAINNIKSPTDIQKTIGKLPHALCVHGCYWENNKWKKKVLVNDGFPQAWVSDPCGLYGGNVVTCWRTGGDYLLLKEMAGPLQQWSQRPPNVDVSESRRERWSSAEKSATFFSRSHFFGSRGGPPAAMQNPYCWLSDAHAKHPPRSCCLGGSGDCQAAVQLAQESSSLMRIRPLLRIQILENIYGCRDPQQNHTNTVQTTSEGKKHVLLLWCQANVCIWWSTIEKKTLNVCCKAFTFRYLINVILFQLPKHLRWDGGGAL